MSLATLRARLKKLDAAYIAYDTAFPIMERRLAGSDLYGLVTHCVRCGALFGIDPAETTAGHDLEVD